MVIEAVKVPSPRSELLVRPEKIPSVLKANESALISNKQSPDKPQCYMCALELDVKHTDVLILSQFVRSDGCMLPKRITGLCARQQKKIGKLVTMAQKAGKQMFILVFIATFYFPQTKPGDIVCMFQVS